MPTKRYVVTLSDAERQTLDELTHKGQQRVRLLKRAQVLLLADEGEPDAAIAETARVGLSTVARTRQRYVEGGVEEALHERPRRGAPPKLDSKQEALLVALACSAPPDERTCWTMQLLADRLVELGAVDAISDETVRRTLKKTRSSLGRSSSGVFPR
jgi:transposase